MKKKSSATATSFDTVREIALALPGVVEGKSYGTPAFKVKGKLFVRLKEDGESIVVIIPDGVRDEMIAAAPETYFITDHYLNHPQYILVRLASIRAEALKDLLVASCKLAGRPHSAK